MTEAQRHQLEALRAAFVGEGEEPAPATCPPPERLADAVAGRLPPAELSALLDHVASCGACIEAWRLARELFAASDAGAPARRRTSGDGWRWAAAAALAALLAGGLWWQLAPPGVERHPGPLILRGGPAAGVHMISADRLPREDLVVRWQAAPDAVAYELELLYDLGEVVAPRRLSDTELRVPPEDLAGIPAGARLDGLLTAIYADGQRGRPTPFAVVLD